MSEALSLKHWRQMFKSYFLIKPVWEEQTRHWREPLPNLLGWENQTFSWAIFIDYSKIFIVLSILANRILDFISNFNIQMFSWQDVNNHKENLLVKIIPSIRFIIVTRLLYWLVWQWNWISCDINPFHKATIYSSFFKHNFTPTMYLWYSLKSNWNAFNS